MPTLNQLIKKGRKPKKRRNKVAALTGSPQKKGICNRVYTTKPKKPNSAIRKVVRVKFSNGYQVICHIPGEGHNLQDHAIVLVRGGRVKDLPGVKYKVIRGKYDLAPVTSRRNGRSRYGAKKPKLVDLIKDKLNKKKNV